MDCHTNIQYISFAITRYYITWCMYSVNNGLCQSLRDSYIFCFAKFIPTASTVYIILSWFICTIFECLTLYLYSLCVCIIVEFILSLQWWAGRVLSTNRYHTVCVCTGCVCACVCECVMHVRMIWDDTYLHSELYVQTYICIWLVHMNANSVYQVTTLDWGGYTGYCPYCQG